MKQSQKYKHFLDRRLYIQDSKVKIKQYKQILFHHPCSLYNKKLLMQHNFYRLFRHLCTQYNRIDFLQYINIPYHHLCIQ